MSFLGNLYIDTNALEDVKLNSEQEFGLLNIKASFHQPVDSNGKPNALPTGGYLYVQIEATSDKKSDQFMGWMMEADTAKNGIIVFSSQSGTSSRILEFKNAFCIRYDEDFDASGATPMTISMVISAQTIKRGTHQLKKNWN